MAGSQSASRALCACHDVSWSQGPVLMTEAWGYSSFQPPTPLLPPGLLLPLLLHGRASGAPPHILSHFIHSVLTAHSPLPVPDPAGLTSPKDALLQILFPLTEARDQVRFPSLMYA